MSKISRRNFFQKTTALAAGCTLPLKVDKIRNQTNTKPKIKRYKPFGKTGFNVGDISAGSGQREPGTLLLQYFKDPHRGRRRGTSGLILGSNKENTGATLLPYPPNRIQSCGFSQIQMGLGLRPLRKKIRVSPRYKKTNKAIKIVKEFLARHMKIRDRDLKKIKLDTYLNEFLWSRGIRNPPHKIRVKAIMSSRIQEAYSFFNVKSFTSKLEEQQYFFFESKGKGSLKPGEISKLNI